VANPPNITNIPAPRVPFIDQRTGLMAREWYRFFLNLFTLTGSGTEPPDVTDDPFLGPPETDIAGELNVVFDQAQLAASIAQVSQQTSTAVEDASLRPFLPQLGLLASEDYDPFPRLLPPFEPVMQDLSWQVTPQPSLGTLSEMNADNVRALGFALDPSPEVVYTPGTLAWNLDDGTLDVGLYGDVVLQAGQEMLYYAKNTSGAQVDKGQGVMFSGTIGASGKLTFDLAVADGSVSHELVMGIATQDIANNDFGYVTDFGLVRGFDTSGANKTVPETWADGDLLYFDPAYPGELTNVQPQAPALHMPIAVVVDASASSSGSIFVRIKTGETLSELIDVYVNGTPADQDMLQYDSGNTRWTNVPASTLLGAPVTKTADFTLGDTENFVINDKSGSACVVTLPAASSWTGRQVCFKTIQAQALDSASSNVVPLAGGAAGTAILTGTAGNWAILVSDGTNWIIMAAN